MSNRLLTIAVLLILHRDHHTPDHTDRTIQTVSDSFFLSSPLSDTIIARHAPSPNNDGSVRPSVPKIYVFKELLISQRSDPNGTLK